jgi:3-methylfumaryl-CoA hydratase
MTPAAASEALKRARARIGRSSEPVRFAIDRSDLRRYATACGETWPAYVAGDEAAPTFISALQSDGMGAGTLFETDLPFTRMLHSDDTVELFRAIVPGDVLVATAHYRDAALKQGRQGPMLFQTAEMMLHDEAGRLVGRVASSLVSF